MLVTLVSSQYARFDALAQAWLAMGASSFSVWQEGRLLAQWPAGRRLGPPSIMANVAVDEYVIGELRVTGINGHVADTRLQADAALISYAAQLENDLQTMTADLVTSQDQQLALYRLMESLRNHVTIKETLQALVAEATRMVAVPAGFAMYVPNSGQDPLILYADDVTVSEELVWRCFWEAHASERDLLTGEDLPAVREYGYRNLLFIPILVRGEVTAGLGLLSKKRSDFGTPQVKLVRAVADQASAQLEKVLLYQESLAQAQLRTEMELARRVQLDLLPRDLPDVKGLDIYAFSRPAFQVGGDFYDFIAAVDRPLIFAIGDVIGKGLSAALLMTMTRTAIHSKAYFMPSPTPEAIMRQSHEDLYHDFTQVGVFATVFIGQYEPVEQRLIHANAGHSPVIYRPRDGTAVLLKADSTAVGVLEASYCRNHSIQMRSGDLLIAATDGFSDVRDNQEDMFGIDRLLHLTNELAHKSAREIADGWFDAVDRFRGGHTQDDDQTLIVIKGVTA